MGIKGMSLQYNMSSYDIKFHTVSRESSLFPYVRENDTIVYECDGKEGTVAFNGYFYVENGPPPYPEDSDPMINRPQRYSEWLPKKLIMYVTLRETEPYTHEFNEDTGFTHTSYKELEKYCYMIEVYKKEVYESTDEISEIDDEDGEPLHVCFFPTNKMKLWFRVLEDCSDIWRA